MTVKININKLILDFVVLLPVTTLFQGKIPIINRVVYFILITALLYMTIIDLHKTMEVIFILMFGIVYMLSFYFTEGVAENINEYFYMLFFVLYARYIVRKYDYMMEIVQAKTKYIKSIVIIWNICVFISLFFSSSYKYGYFFSFTGDVFRSATSAFFILSLLLIIEGSNMIKILYAILPMFCLFSGGSRTYLAIGLAAFLIMYYMVAPSRRFFCLSLIPVGAIVVYALLNSNIMDKINSSLTVSSTDYYQDFLVKFTSGRSIFWAADLNAFINGSLINQVFGFGYNFVYDVNQYSINSRIWAHNDFINILLNYGYIGLICYIGMFSMMFRKCVNRLNLPFWLKVTMLFIWVFNAIFNMFYTYSCAVTSYPFILLGISMFWEKKIARRNLLWENMSEQ